MAEFAGSQLLGSLLTTVQVLSVVAGVVISVGTFGAGWEKEADARKLEAIKPFLDLRRELYRKAVDTAAVLANSDIHTPDEVQTAKKQFRDLYVAQLSMVECRDVESEMIQLAGKIDKELLKMSDAQNAAYELSHALSKSYVGPLKKLKLVDLCPDDDSTK